MYTPHPFLDSRTLPPIASSHFQILLSTLAQKGSVLSSTGVAAKSNAAGLTRVASIISTVAAIYVKAAALRVCIPCFDNVANDFAVPS